MARTPRHAIVVAALTTSLGLLAGRAAAADQLPPGAHDYNGPYTGEHLNRIAFPLGGIGAGMIALEGTGAISHVSVRNEMEFFNEPFTLAALCIRRPEGNIAKVLEGPVPDWKIFGGAGTGNGGAGRSWGLPRFDEAEFLARFPFATITLRDDEIPLKIELTGWSPFTPPEADDSSLPAAALEYRFTNTGRRAVDAVFSYHAKDFMALGNRGDTIRPFKNGFILRQDPTDDHPEHEGGCAIFVDDENAIVDHGWFRGGWWDSVTLAWRNVQEGRLVDNPPQAGRAPGASLFVPLTLQPGETRTVRLSIVWYVPNTTLRAGRDAPGPAFAAGPSRGTAPQQQEVTGFLGSGLVNTFDPYGDAATGTLTSPPFTLTHDSIQFLIGGGNHSEKTCLQLLVDDEIVRRAAGRDTEHLEWTTWNIAELKGKTARLRIVDEETGAWGHINVDHIILTDREWKSAAELMRHRPAWDEAVVVLNDFEGDDFGDWIAEGPPAPCGGPCADVPTYHTPWSAGRFESLDALADYWRDKYDDLRDASATFRDAFYDSTLPPEVIEAVAANLTILKSPTVLRQTDGRLWCFEGCCDSWGCCHGSCTHVWNYAQALPHLFPTLERSLRRTEFHESQDERGHQTFRSCLPIRPVAHTFHAAADGQLGGILKVHRDWRISGDDDWLRAIWPRVRKSLDYCIETWDPRGRGVLEEPHHNTYDIEYWGPDGHCSSFYLGALAAAVRMGEVLGEDVSRYRALLADGRRFLETELYNGEYFYQRVQTEGLNAEFRPLDASANGEGYNEIIAALNEQGPKYQYGEGCLSDGVLGFWMARVCGLDQNIVDEAKVRSNLRAIHRYNLRHDLTDHANPQRPTFALGRDGGLLLCTWPHGNAPALPFVYSDEVWTGIEYQVASHLMMEGLVEEGLEIVRLCRDRYDGRVRNPFNEYECGHWYARAMSSYALLQGLTGVRYDAVEKTLYINSQVGDDFRGFVSTATGYGVVGLDRGRPFIDVRHGRIDTDRIVFRESGRD
ncbi:MAG: GH116 family glycosyl hydrolase [Planctomycetota bacterium]|nr:GH116 family glycosyl hydrolase [Planctomycetota bacterium]